MLHRSSSTLLLSALTSFAACTKRSFPKPPDPKDFRVLTYSSMTGSKSLGEMIERIYKQKCLALKQPQLRCEITLIPESGDSSLVSAYLTRPSGFDAILGLEKLQVAALKQKAEILRTELFSRGPHAFIVDTKAWSDPAKWPKSWKDLAKFPRSAFIEDPRVSSVGIGWLKAIFVHNLISLEDSKKVTKKIFPSWSLAYGAFQNGGAPLVWSYQSSEAYHRCEEKTDRFRALPLEEGYPVQEEYLVIPTTRLARETDLLAQVLLSPEIQTQIPLKNWMWPASDKTPVPDCFKQSTPVKTLADEQSANHAKKIQAWMDQWGI